MKRLILQLYSKPITIIIVTRPMLVHYDFICPCCKRMVIHCSHGQFFLFYFWMALQKREDLCLMLQNVPSLHPLRESWIALALVIDRHSSQSWKRGKYFSSRFSNLRCFSNLIILIYDVSVKMCTQKKKLFWDKKFVCHAIVIDLSKEFDQN